MREVNWLFARVEGALLLKHRILCLFDVVLFVTVLLLGDQVSRESSPPVAPLPVRLLAAIAGPLLAAWLIEHHDTRWQLFVGWAVLIVFFVVPVYGIIFEL